MVAADKDTSYRLAYDEAIRALSQQQAWLESFRTRAGSLLSAAAITTSFLGAQALSTGSPGVVTWLALTSFVGLSICALAILWPQNSEFTVNPEDIIASYIEADEPLTPDRIHRDLSLHMHDSYADNLVDQKRLAYCLRFAGVLLTIEVSLWIIDLALKG